MDRRTLLASVAGGAAASLAGCSALEGGDDADVSTVDDGRARELAEQFAPTLYFDENEQWLSTDPRPFAREIPVVARENAVKMEVDPSEADSDLTDLAVEDDFAGRIYDAPLSGPDAVYVHRGGAYTTEVRDAADGVGAFRVTPGTRSACAWRTRAPGRHRSRSTSRTWQRRRATRWRPKPTTTRTTGPVAAGARRTP
ncbi:hypothetical protein BRC89_11070 [Halobacteriales archaeon QS_4_70_19]|nr:MAG: hypothetical protein BRC89_11070 [Halobacteriales archaeon QS_4_70_19]